MRATSSTLLFLTCLIVGHFYSQRADIKFKPYALRIEPRGEAVGLWVHSATGNFERVTLEFVGEGVAVSGDVPKLRIEGPASSEPLWISVPDVKQIPVRGLASLEDPEKSVRISLEDFHNEWPDHWVLKRMTFFKPGSEELVLEGASLKKSVSGDLIF